MKPKSRKENERRVIIGAVLIIVLYIAAFGIPSLPSPTPPPTNAKNGIKFSSIIQPFTYAAQGNFRTNGASFPVEVNTTMQINVVYFDQSDRAYDLTNITVYLETQSGSVLATGTFSEWGPNGNNGNAAPTQLSNVVTLTANTPYKFAFSALPSSDLWSGSGIDMDLIQEQAPIGGGYLGQTQWPIFVLGLMNLLPTTTGLTNYNYLSFTDLFSSAGYQGNIENAIRFQATSSEQLTSFEVYAISSDGSSNSLVFTLRSDDTSTGSHPTPLSIAPALATASVTDAQVKANLTANSNAPVTGQSTFIKVNFPSHPSLTKGAYYWIVIASASRIDGVTLGRLVNPYVSYVLNSANDFQTWGVPADGPTDLSYRITTTGQSIINTIQGQSKLNYFTQVAQSIMPTKGATVNGAFIQVDPQGHLLTVAIETDSGSDSPSGTILASGTTSAVLFDFFSYASFTSSVALSPNVKYWLVFSVGACISPSGCSSPNYVNALIYRPDFYNSANDYGGSNLHYETGTNGVWTTPTGGLGDLTFTLTSPA